MCKAYLSMWRGVSFYRLSPCINLLLIPLMWCIYEISVMSGSFSVATTNRLLLGVTIDISNKCWSLAIYSSINASNECCFYFFFFLEKLWMLLLDDALRLWTIYFALINIYPTQLKSNIVCVGLYQAILMINFPLQLETSNFIIQFLTW